MPNAGVCMPKILKRKERWRIRDWDMTIPPLRGWGTHLTFTLSLSLCLSLYIPSGKIKRKLVEIWGFHVQVYCTYCSVDRRSYLEKNVVSKPIMFIVAIKNNLGELTHYMLDERLDWLTDFYKSLIVFHSGAKVFWWMLLTFQQEKGKNHSYVPLKMIIPFQLSHQSDWPKDHSEICIFAYPWKGIIE